MPPTPAPRPDGPRKKPSSAPADLEGTLVGGEPDLADLFGSDVAPRKPPAKPASTKPVSKVKPAGEGTRVAAADLERTLVPPKPATRERPVTAGDDLGDTAQMGGQQALRRTAATGAAAGSTKTGTGKPSGGMSSSGAASTDGGEGIGGAELRGKTALNDFRLLKKLGQGGMGAVFLAHQESLDRTAAVKVLSEQLAGKEDFVKRFYREARSMAKVDHPNAVKVYAVDQDDGLHYVAMEFVDGQSLQKWMDQLGQLSVGDSLHIVLRVAEALSVAHQQNMVHRDIKPDNIMLTKTGVVKVADFGLAKALDEDQSMTQSGTGLGTPYYMAPEQARNAKHVDGRSDIYALGITLYYFLTGKLPFVGDSTLELLVAKEKGKFTPARKHNSAIPERLDLMIDKMIAKDPDHRFKSCAEVIKHLAGLGLANPALSFVKNAVSVSTSTGGVGAATAVGGGAKTGVGNRTAVPGKGGPGMTKPTPGQTSIDEKARSQMGAIDPNQEWFVQYRGADGKLAAGRFKTSQVQQMLRAGSIDPGAQAKKKMADPFLPIAHYREFENLVHGLLIKQQAATKSSGNKQKFADIERQYRWRKVFQKIRGFFSSLMGLGSFVIYLGVIVGGLAGIWIFRATIWNFVAHTINKMNGFE